MFEELLEARGVVEEEPHGDNEELGLKLTVEVADGQEEPRIDPVKPGDTDGHDVWEEFELGVTDTSEEADGDGVNSVVLDWILVKDTLGDIEAEEELLDETDRLWIAVWNEEADTESEGVVELEIEPVWDSSGETDVDGTKLGVSKEDHEGSTEADTSELWEPWDVLEADNKLVSVGFGVGDIVCSGVLEPYGLSEWRDVWDTEFDGDADIEGSGEPDRNGDPDISELGEFEKLAVCVSMELWDWLSDSVVVEDPWPDGVDDTEGLTVTLGEADKDIWDVEVFDTDVEPDTDLDFRGDTETLDDTVWDLDTSGVMEPLGVRVPVFETELDPDTEFVDE